MDSPENCHTENGGCGCDGDCGQPEKKRIWPTVIFAIVILAAIGIIAAKLLFMPSVAPASTSGKSEMLHKSDSRDCADSCNDGSACDTTRGSSCCGK